MEPTFHSDLLLRKAMALNFVLVKLLADDGLPAPMAQRLLMVLPTVELVMLVGCVASAAAYYERLSRDPAIAGGRRWVLHVIGVAGGLYSLRLLVWLHANPSHELAAFVCRWDYLIFAILAGTVLQLVPLRVRHWVLAVLSVVFVSAYVGSAQVEIILFGCLLGFAATRWTVTNRPGRRVVVQAMLVVGIGLWVWRLRASSPLDALRAWGLYSFVAFRHVSFVVESSRGVPATLGGYICFLLFYPSCIGAMEVYREFWERNLTGDGARDLRGGALMVAKGAVLVWIGFLFEVNEDVMVQSVGFVTMWTNVVVLFLRAACLVSGIWAIVEGGALFLGIHLRPNFRGVLTAANPSQFWRAWRGTMTNWLVQYIYIPLGGNRRHQTLNILAAFAVSTAWHCMGITFLRPQTYTVADFLPILTWGGVNFAGVAIHAWSRRRWVPVGERTPLRSALHALQHPLTLVYASLTPCLLGFSLGRVERFTHVARTLLGLEGW